MAVVDGYGRVHEMQGLRVIDASIMPLIITGNLNATTIMMAEKLADHIRGKQALPASTAPFYGRASHGYILVACCIKEYSGIYFYPKLDRAVIGFSVIHSLLNIIYIL